MRLFLGGKHVFLRYGESMMLKSERSSHCLEAQAFVPLLYPTLSTDMVTSPCPASGGRDVLTSLFYLPCEEDPDNASMAASTVSWLWLWLRNNIVTSASLRTGPVASFYSHPPSASPEQGFSASATSASCEELVQAQTTCSQTRLWELPWRNKKPFCFILIILHSLVFCFLDAKVLLLSPSLSTPRSIFGAKARRLTFPPCPLLPVHFHHHPSASW